jgi:ABC-type uncharacterized transport system substrate-binding protein
MAIDIGRREFIVGLGGALFVRPLAVRAQQAEKIAKIGVLFPGGSPPAAPRMESFRNGLRQRGYVEGQNIAIELRYAERGLQQLPDLAAELVGLKVDVITTFGDLATKVAQQATGTQCQAARTVAKDCAGNVPRGLPVGPHDRSVAGEHDGERSSRLET